MNDWSLPIEVEISDKVYKIRDKCDYRVVLDVICALNDNELDNDSKVDCALFIFYEDLNELENMYKSQNFIEYKEVKTALFNELIRIINVGESPEPSEKEKPKLMDWEKDYTNITPPISRVLGYSVRSEENYTHWYDFVGAYMEIGDCYFAQIISIRNKIRKGKKLDEQDKLFYKEHKKDIDLPNAMTDEDRKWLDEEL